jgi:hypothetical protein
MGVVPMNPSQAKRGRRDGMAAVQALYVATSFAVRSSVVRARIRC